jgi:RsiW-degrading membrane proteinase PrsW (M82 family)
MMNRTNVGIMALGAANGVDDDVPIPIVPLPETLLGQHTVDGGVQTGVKAYRDPSYVTDGIDSTNIIDRSTTMTTTTTNYNNNKEIRGGWTTSICGLFQDPTRKSDFCAVTCFGVLLMDRNEYLLSRFRSTTAAGRTQQGAPQDDDLHHEDGVRPNWKRRCVLTFAIPLILQCIIMYLATTEGTNSTMIGTLHLVLLGCIIFLLYTGRVQRYNIRKQVVNKLSLERQQEEEGQQYHQGNNTRENEYMGRAVMMDTGYATAVCCCYSKDVVSTSGRMHQQQQQQLQDGTTANTATKRGDLGTCLWNALAACCCGGCCGCWLQCCGSCGTNQETIEIERLLFQEDPGHLFVTLQIDYITFQPFQEYYTRFLNLRSMGPAPSVIQEWTNQWNVLSDLSKHILRWFIGGMVVLGILSICLGKEGMYLLAIIGTTVQSGLVLYLLHWRWNRDDISVDAIIKYTASGFVLAIFMAIVIEQVFMVMLGLIFTVFIIFDLVTLDTHGVPIDQWTADPSNIQQLEKDHWGQLAFVAIVLSFLIAAFTEELMKYYTYWMTETPDLKTLSELGMVGSSNDGAGIQGRNRPEVDTIIRRSKATTIAMVAVATGFAWSENIMYIQKQHGMYNMAIILLFRSILPVHELCAALQSIGIVRRDIENHPQWQLGNSIFSAVLVHGLYDFVLIFGGIVTVITKDLDDTTSADGGGNNNVIVDPNQPLKIRDVLMGISYGLPVLLLAVWYYVWEAKKQRLRLQAMEGYSTIDRSAVDWTDIDHDVNGPIDDVNNNYNNNNNYYNTDDDGGSTSGGREYDNAPERAVLQMDHSTVASQHDDDHPFV